MYNYQAHEFTKSFPYWKKVFKSGYLNIIEENISKKLSPVFFTFCNIQSSKKTNYCLIVVICSPRSISLCDVVEMYRIKWKKNVIKKLTLFIYVVNIVNLNLSFQKFQICLYEMWKDILMSIKIKRTIKTQIYILYTLTL